MIALTIMVILITIALVGAKDQPKAKEELKNDTYLNTNSDDATIGRILLSLIFK